MIVKPRVQKIRVRKWLDPIGGGTASLMTPDKLAEPMAGELFRQAHVRADEEVLLVNYRSDSEWCVLTTTRLVWYQDEVLDSLPWHEIAGAQQPPEKAAKIIRGELSNDVIADLEVYDGLDKRYVLKLEPGEVYYIIWSAILAFSKLSRKPDPIPL